MAGRTALRAAKVRREGWDRAAATYGGGVTLPAPKVDKTDDEWRTELSPAAYQVLRQAGTERPWTGEYVEEHRVGVYRCRACGTELFRSDTKFDSHCGWPSFWSPLAGDRVILREDRGLGMVRVEVLCATCHSHLGHVFSGEGYGTPTDDRYCINSISLTFEPAEQAVDAERAAGGERGAGVERGANAERAEPA